MISASLATPSELEVSALDVYWGKAQKTAATSSSEPLTG